MIKLTKEGKENRDILYSILKELKCYSAFIECAKDYDKDFTKQYTSFSKDAFNEALNNGRIIFAFYNRFAWSCYNFNNWQDISAKFVDLYNKKYDKTY